MSPQDYDEGENDYDETSILDDDGEEDEPENEETKANTNTANGLLRNQNMAKNEAKSTELGNIQGDTVEEEDDFDVTELFV
jgi:hypothetical protein